MEKRYTQRPKRTTQKLRSEQKSVTPSPLSSEERKQLKANVPENILLDVQHVTTVADVKDLGEVLQEGMAKDKDESCDTEKARYEFGKAVSNNITEIEAQTKQATEDYDASLEQLQGPEKTFFKTLVDMIKVEIARIFSVFQSSEKEVYQAGQPGTCTTQSTVKKYLKKAWSAITFVSGWAIDITAWILRNPALAQILTYILKVLRDDFCQWASLKLGNWAITEPKSLFEKLKGKASSINELVTRFVIIPFMADYFSPVGYFAIMFDVFSTKLSQTTDSIIGLFTSGIVNAISLLSDSVGGVIGNVGDYVTSGFNYMKDILNGAIKVALIRSTQGLVQYYALNFIYDDIVHIFSISTCVKPIEIEINGDLYKQYVAAGYISPEQDAKYQEQLRLYKKKSWTLFDVVLF